MSQTNQLNLKGTTKLLKKSIQQELFAQGIEIVSKSNNKEFLFWLQTISSQSHNSDFNIKQLAKSIATEIIQICQQQNKSNLDKSVIHSLAKTNLTNFAELNREAAKTTVAIDNSTPSQTKSEPLPTSIPSELIELFQANSQTGLVEAWKEFDRQLKDEASQPLSAAEITGRNGLENLTIIARGNSGLAIANLQDEAFDLPVAKLSALNVGEYRELQSDLIFHLGNGQDGNKYIDRWGDGDRGGIQVDPQTVLLFVKV